MNFSSTTVLSSKSFHKEEQIQKQFSDHQVVLLACDNEMSANLIKNGHF